MSASPTPPARPSADRGAGATSGRRRRFAGSHPYPELPRSRLPYLRALAWIAVAALRVGIEFLRPPWRHRGDHATGDGPARRQAVAARRAQRLQTPARTASLTPY